MFRIAVNKLSGWLFSRVLASHAGSIPGLDMFVLGPLDQNRDGQVSLLVHIFPKLNEAFYVLVKAYRILTLSCRSDLARQSL
jgi:hypothetical protein